MLSVAISATSADTETAPLGKTSARRRSWGVILLAPYVFVFLAFVIYPVCYGFWIGRRPESYVTLFDDPIFCARGRQYAGVSDYRHQSEDGGRAVLSDFFVQQRAWIRWLAALFILPWALPSIPTILSIRFMLNPEWGLVNSLIFRLTGEDGPNWLNDPTLALSLAILTHIWKSLRSGP